jgi:biotin carboxyl carrier protein
MMRLYALPAFLVAFLSSPVIASAAGPAQGGPAHVAGGQPESALATITLTPAAEKRLGLEFAQITRQPVRETRKLPGQVLVPPGRSTLVSAPFAGIVLPTPNRELPAVGTALRQGNAVMRIQPLPGADEALRMRAEARINEQRWQVARQRAEAARAGLQNRTVTQQELANAEAALAEAETARQASRSLWGFIEDGNPANAVTNTAITVAAPRGGLLQNLHVTAGQAVSAGQPLFEVLGQNVLWVKVPIYTGELRTIDRSVPAHVVPLGAWDAATGVPVRPFTGPVSGNSGAATIDLYYTLDNPQLQFRPEERVTVILPVTRATQALTVPASAIWRDIYGGTWVYAHVGEHKYSRRRVIVSRIIDGVALLTTAPPIGTRVVTVGVAELAGTEFGVPH